MIDLSENGPVWAHAKQLYSVGRRGYHRFEHALDVLERVKMVEEEIGFLNYEAVQLAALFHDAVYVAGAKDNEQKSVNELNSFFMSGAGGPDVMMDDFLNIVARAASLIMDTAEHMNPDYTENWDSMLFMDCDVLGFAENWEQFQKQNEDIKYEYGDDVNLMMYAQGRIKFLTALFDKGVFRSPYFIKRYEERALLNIKASLRELGVSL